MPDDCDHCEHYTVTVGQLFDTAIELDDAEERLERLRIRLRSAAEAIVWLLAQRQEPVPAWIQTALGEVESSV